MKPLLVSHRSNSLDNPQIPLTGATLSKPGFLWDAWTSGAASGINVSYKNAIYLSAVYRAVLVYAENIASLQIKVISRDEEGNKNEVRSHPVARLLRDPHALYTAYDFWETIMIQLLLSCGESFVYIQRDNGFQPRGLIIEPNPNAVQVLLTENDELVYKLPSRTELVPARNILHWKGLSFDSLEVENPIKMAKEIFGLGLSNQNFKGNLYKNGTHLGGYIRTQNALKEEAYKNLAESWKQRHGGINNAGGTAILEEGAEYVPLGLKADENKFIETQKFITEEVGRFFNIPPHMLHHLDRMTFNNINALDRNFVKYSLRPWVKKLEEELWRKLLPESEKDNTNIHFNLNSLLRGDLKERAELIKVMYQTGALSPNEIRRMEDMNAYEGGEKYYRPLNMHPVGDPLPERSRVADGNSRSDEKKHLAEAN